MAITINQSTRLISIDQSELTFVSGTLWDADTDAIRLSIIDILDGESHMWMPDAINHNTEVAVAGVTYARVIEVINSYSLQFEDTGSAYTVRLLGSNNNYFDTENGILVPTPLVTVISTNSAGLQVLSVGSGLSTDQATQLLEIYTRLGLNVLDAITDTPAGIDSDSGGIDITRSGDGETSSTLTRQP